MIEDGNCVVVQKISFNKGLSNLKNLHIGNRVFYSCSECDLGSMILREVEFMIVDLTSLENLSFGNESCYSCNQFIVKSWLYCYPGVTA